MGFEVVFLSGCIFERRWIRRSPHFQRGATFTQWFSVSTSWVLMLLEGKPLLTWSSESCIPVGKYIWFVYTVVQCGHIVGVNIAKGNPCLTWDLEVVFQ